MEAPGPQSAWIVYNNPATPGHQNSVRCRPSSRLDLCV